MVLVLLILQHFHQPLEVLVEVVLFHIRLVDQVHLDKEIQVEMGQQLAQIMVLEVVEGLVQ